jgi:hypothetical protein
MTSDNGAGDHHESAARHHERAAHFHREASRQYRIGTDYAHAAHLALTARAHALRALEDGQAASARYTEQEFAPLPFYLKNPADHPPACSAADLDGSALHTVAAEHHDAAVLHHALAKTHRGAAHYIRANTETRKALDHGKHAIFHDDAAAMYYMERRSFHPAAERA